MPPVREARGRPGCSPESASILERTANGADPRVVGRVAVLRRRAGCRLCREPASQCATPHTHYGTGITEQKRRDLRTADISRASTRAQSTLWDRCEAPSAL